MSDAPLRTMLKRAREYASRPSLKPPPTAYHLEDNHIFEAPEMLVEITSTRVLRVCQQRELVITVPTDDPMANDGVVDVPASMMFPDADWWELHEHSRISFAGMIRGRERFRISVKANPSRWVDGFITHDTLVRKLLDNKFSGEQIRKIMSRLKSQE